MRIIAVTALSLALLSAPRAQAQPAVPQVDDPEATLLSELLVIAPTEGPAWWRVSKGDSVVWIMALPAGSVPQRLTWDTRALDRRLKGAHAVLAPPWVQFHVRYSRAAATNDAEPRPPRTRASVEESLPEDLAARFTAARTRIKRTPVRYAIPSPAVAFFRLNEDHQKWAKLRPGREVMTTVEARAKKAKVVVTRPARVDAGTMGPAEVAPTVPAAAACFDAILDSTEVPVEQHRAAASGWARGDLKAAIAAPREPLSICENRLFNRGASRRAIEVQVAAIETALTKPGKTVAMAPLRALVADEGILDRLKAKGYQIIYPTTLDEGVD